MTTNAAPSCALSEETKARLDRYRLAHELGARLDISDRAREEGA
jgi:hypothetical protein